MRMLLILQSYADITYTYVSNNTPFILSSLLLFYVVTNPPTTYSSDRPNTNMDRTGLEWNLHGTHDAQIVLDLGAIAAY